jgi:hypothetical protein
VSIALRSFRNTDTDAICRIWNDHHAGQPTCQMTPLQFELCVLAKPYFHAEQLMVASVDEELKGFAHFAPAIAEEGWVNPDGHSILSSLCVSPYEEETILAEILLAEIERAQIAKGARCSLTRPMPPECPFYLGLGLGDSMMGITTNDRRAYSWLIKAGYEPRIATSGWELHLSEFQAPIDRLQIQIRRNAHVDRMLEEPQMPWWHACVLGHTEPTGFQLTLRSEGQVAQDLLVWNVSPELATSSESVVWMWPIQVGPSQQSTDQLVFLIAEALRQMAEERVDVVRTVSDSSQQLVAAVLTRLGFRNSLSGVVLEKQFTEV